MPESNVSRWDALARHLQPYEARWYENRITYLTRMLLLEVRVTFLLHLQNLLVDFIRSNGFPTTSSIDNNSRNMNSIVQFVDLTTNLVKTNKRLLLLLFIRSKGKWDFSQLTDFLLSHHLLFDGRKILSQGFQLFFNLCLISTCWPQYLPCLLNRIRRNNKIVLKIFDFTRNDFWWITFHRINLVKDLLNPLGQNNDCSLHITNRTNYYTIKSVLDCSKVANRSLRYLTVLSSMIHDMNIPSNYHVDKEKAG